jgi:hypothetical protein
MCTIIHRSFIDNCGKFFNPQLKNQRIEKQKRHLARIELVQKPQWCWGFVWTFLNDTFIYGGWHLYVKTLHNSWGIGGRDRHLDQFLPVIMSLFPCGMLPFEENFHDWKEVFAKTYPHPYPRREKEGLALVRVLTSKNDMINIKGAKS